MQIPETHLDLVERPIVISLATTMPDGQPQVTPVWFSYDGEYVKINSARGRQKDINLRERPEHVTLLFLDPDNPYRYMEIRGEAVTITEEGALEHINELAKRYFGREQYYRTAEHQARETRVIYYIKPETVNASG